MSFITDLAQEVANAPELAPIESQKDVQVRILTIERGPSKRNPENNPDQLVVTYELPDFPNAYAIKKYISLPVNERMASELGCSPDDSKKYQGKLRGLKEFIGGHKWDFEAALSAIYAKDDAGNRTPDTSFLVGSTAWTIVALKTDTYKDESGVERTITKNEIEKYL